VIRGQNLNRFGTVIRKISQGIGYGTGDAIFDHMAVTSIDNVGRALTTAYFPTASSVTGDVAAATSPATLAPPTETIAYDLNADGTPDFTRVLDRSQDTLGRDNGWQLKNGATVENAVTYNFDTAGRLGNVASPAGSFTYAYQTNSMGLINTVTGPAHTVTNIWEPTRDVLTRKQNMVGAAIISAYDYTVNALGQRTNVGNTGSAFASARSIAWGYDSLGQVTKADSSISGFDRAYQYDAIGNRKKAANSLTLPAADNYTANALNQYTAVGTIIPTYDDDGNATAYPVPTRLTANSTLSWDAENRMKSANVNGVTTTYLYDAGSRRIAQTTGATTTVYVYDAWNPVAEYTGNTLKKTYAWGSDLSGSLQGAGGVGGLLAVTDQVAAGKPSYFPTFDGNGNVSEYLTSAGASVAHYEYDPFGRSTTATGTLATSFAHRFSTKPVDGPTGLYYYGYRYLDPVTGRWPSRDAIEERGGVNLYGFVQNAPLSGIDLIGLEILTPKYLIGSVSECYTFTHNDVSTEIVDGKEVEVSGPETIPDGQTRFSAYSSISSETGCTITIEIRVNLKGGSNKLLSPYYLYSGYAAKTDAEAAGYLDVFNKGIDERWNNLFRVKVGKMFYQKISKNNALSTHPAPDKYCDCALVIKLVQEDAGPRVGIFTAPWEISEQWNWNVGHPNKDPGQVAAHEVGHYLGNVEDYGVSKGAKISGRSKPYGSGVGTPDTGSVMGRNVGKAKERHFWRIVELLSSQLGKAELVPVK